MKLARVSIAALGLLLCSGGAYALPVTASFDVHANNDVWNFGNGDGTKVGDPGLATGIDLTAGDYFSVVVDDPADTWLFCGGADASCRVDADGRRANGTFFGTYTDAGFSAHHGTLVGRIGAGGFFAIGTAGFFGTANATGQLHLYHWDHNANNSETIAVTFTAPEPGAVALLGLGLAAISVVRRRRAGRI